MSQYTHEELVDLLARDLVNKDGIVDYDGLPEPAKAIYRKVVEIVTESIVDAVRLDEEVTAEDRGWNNLCRYLIGQS